MRIVENIMPTAIATMDVTTRNAIGMAWIVTENHPP